MKELIAIIVNEKKSLLSGFIAVFMLALPLTFLPTLLKHGFSLYQLQLRIPESILYASLISLAVICYALLNNYEKLLHKKRIFNLPAFTALHFHGGIEGYDSIIKELSTYLIGKVGNYYFKIDIIAPEQDNFKVEIAPMIYVEEDSNIVERLISELGFKENLYLSRIIDLSEEQLQEDDALREELLHLSDELTLQGVIPIEVDEKCLLKTHILL